MKKNVLFFLGAILCIGSTFCGKDTGETAQRKRAEEFQTNVKSKRFKLVDFYSDLPIDYIENDVEVRQETDLRPYIKQYLVDDEDMFAAEGGLMITQNETKIPGDESSVINRTYRVRWNATEALLDFVDYYYQPLAYKLSDYSATGFTIYLNWHKGNAKIYSRYELIP